MFWKASFSCTVTIEASTPSASTLVNGLALTVDCAVAASAGATLTARRFVPAAAIVGVVGAVVVTAMLIGPSARYKIIATEPTPLVKVTGVVVPKLTASAVGC